MLVQVRGLPSPFRQSLPAIRLPTPAKSDQAAVKDLTEFDDTVHEQMWGRTYDEMKQWKRPTRRGGATLAMRKSY
eukprot:915971-Pyramimonas_sp.AAC.1